MVEVIMPKMGDAMEEGTLVEWLKGDGDAVKSGDIIGNIQTDKATVELTAPSTGKLAGLLAKPGETIAVGKPLAAILKEGEQLPGSWGSSNGSAKPSDPPTEAPKQEAPPEEKQPVSEQKAPAAPSPPAAAPVATAEPRGGERVFASPLARRLAKEAGISLENVHGSGPSGRIVERDVKAAQTSAPSHPTNRQDREVALTNLQRITAERTGHSKATVPHYYVTVEVDVEALEGLREQMNADSPDQKLSLNDFIIKASALALQDQPHINASFQNGKRLEYGAVNIGVAAAVPDGLTLPVLHNCESKPLRQVAAEVRDLIGKARENKLGLDKLSGATFAISNMGMFDVENFSAIINEPNGAIIAVSTAKRVPVVVDSDEGYDIEARMRMKITGSFDHRIIDGAVGAQFMGVLKSYLEAPTRLLT